MKLRYKATGNREEWLMERKKGIGSSDSSALLGVSTFNNALDVYLDKTCDGIDLSPMSENQRIGLELEPSLIDTAARRWVEKHPGDVVTIVPSDGMYEHEKYPHLLATPDSFMVINGELVDLSIKTSRMFSEWDDDSIPDHARVQSLHMMEVIPELRYSVILALLFKPEIVIRKVERDEQIQNAILNTGRDFWDNHVTKRTPPPLEDVSYQSISHLYPHDDGSQIILPEDVRQMVIEYRNLAAEEKKFKEAKEKIQASIVSHFGEAQVGLSGDLQASWKTQWENRVNLNLLREEQPEIARKYTERRSKRVFRTKEIK